MSVVITTYTLASGLMQQGMTLVAGDAHHPARQHDRARADDPQRARRHEVRRVVSGAVPRQLRRARARTCRRSCARWSRAAGSAFRPGSAALALEHAARPRRGRRGRRCRGDVWIAFAIVLAGAGRDHRPRPRGHQEARKLVGAAAARRRRAAARRGRSRRGGGLGHILARVDAAADDARAVLAAVSRRR